MSKRSYEKGKAVKAYRKEQWKEARKWLKAHDIEQCNFHSVMRRDELKGTPGECKECRSSEQPAWTVIDTVEDWQLEELANARGIVSSAPTPDIREMYPGLSELDADALQLRAEGCSWREMGELLGISHTAAKKRFERARQHLLALLTEGQGWDDVVLIDPHGIDQEKGAA